MLPGLHSVSLELLAAWKRPDSQALLPPWAKANVDLMLADATAFPWDDADVWFANSTCFDETLLLKLAVIADRMRVGTHAITFTKRLPSDKWTVSLLSHSQASAVPPRRVLQRLTCMLSSRLYLFVLISQVLESETQVMSWGYATGADSDTSVFAEVVAFVCVRVCVCV